MNTAHPASFPPGPRLSEGIKRSTAASITAASSAVKNIQGPGRTTTGGVAVPASHGRLPLRVRARAKVVPTRTNAVADANNERRDGCEEIMRCMVSPRAQNRTTILNEAKRRSQPFDANFKMASGRYALAPTITSYHLIADRNGVVQSLKGAVSRGSLITRPFPLARNFLAFS